MHRMQTPKDILDYVGQDAAAIALGVKADSVRRAAKGQKLPAAWLDTLEHLARRPLDRRVFTFKRANHSELPDRGR